MRVGIVDLWPAGLFALAMLGVAPGALLRQIVRIYPKDHPRRLELVAELYTVEHHKQLLFVLQHLELAISEGIPARWRDRPLNRSSPAGPGVPDLGFRGPQVCKIVGITYRQLDYWARTDLIRPSIDGQRTGTQRRYSYRDLVELKVVRALLDAGVSLNSARRAIEFLHTNLGEEVASASLVTDRTGSTLVRSDRQLVALVRRSQGVVNIVALGSVKEALDAAIMELPVPTEGVAMSKPKDQARARRVPPRWRRR